MPDWTRDVLRALAPLELRPEREREIADELTAHLDDRYHEALGRGFGDDEARHAALAELGDVLVPELRRVESPWRPSAPVGAGGRARPIETFLQDARYALRSLRLSPGFTAVSLLTLGLGIGACTLILSAVNSVLLRPLPFQEPERLVVFWGTAPERGLPEISFPLGVAALYHQRARTLESIAAFTTGGFNLSVNGEAERVDRGAVSIDFFRVLGVRPLLGRVPVAGEDAPDGTRVVVLGHALWMRRFGGDSAVVGRTIQFNDAPVTVVGVMPPGFDYPNRSEAWTPLYVDATRFNCWCYDVIGRMRPGVSPEQVVIEIGTINGDFSKVRPDVFSASGRSPVVAMRLGKRIAGTLEAPLLVLLAAVGCVLLIACANIANLLLARTAARARELAVRCCLGASATRVAAQLLTESALLSLGGAVLGVLVATWGTNALRRLPVAQFPRIDQVRIDPTILLATVALAVVTALLCGAAPAIRATRVDLQDAMKSGAKGSAGRSSRRASNVFVVVQFALALVLLVSAGLLVRSYRALVNVDAGYRVDGVQVARLQLPFPRYDSAATVRAFYARLLDNVRAIPGVRAAALASRVPLSKGNPQDVVLPEGPELSAQTTRVSNIRVVTGDYFAAIGTPLVRGRTFAATDDHRAPRVAVVDQSFATHFWGAGDPIGRRIRHFGDTSAGRWITVIGVAKNVKHGALDEPGDLQVYEHFAQQTPWSNYLVVHADGGDGLVAGLRRAIREVDPSIPLHEVHTLRDAVGRSVGTRRLTNLLLGGFASMAIVLAAIGIFGVMSLGVNARVREFGIRLALGARPMAVRALVLRQAMSLALGGVIVGVIGAAIGTRYLRALLFGVGPLDWVTFVAVAAFLTAAALAAAFIPALRATRVDPTIALRAE